MTEQRFFKGDMVRIRPFDEIDASDIGTVGLTSNICFSITKHHINEKSKDYPYLLVVRHSRECDTHIYTLKDPESDSKEICYWWAQGMLYPYEEESLSEEDADVPGLFGFLYAQNGEFVPGIREEVRSCG